MQQGDPHTESMPATAILVVHVAPFPRDVADSWSHGPWPVPLPRAAFPKFLYSDHADRVTREAFLERRVHGLLYGSGDEVVRWHRWLGQGDARLPGGWQIMALELLSYPEAGPAGALLAVHVELADPPEDCVAAITTLANVRPVAEGDEPGEITRPALEAVIQNLLPSATLQNARVGFVVSHVAFPSGPPEGLVPDSVAPASVQWSRVLALANEPAALPDHLSEPLRQPCDVPLSRSWVACVLKSGASFVGRTGTHEDGFHELAKALVHSVYLDALLLGLVQRDCVDELSNTIGDMWETGSTQRRAAFERTMIRFRSDAWWSDISETTAVNQVLRALQGAYDLPDRQDRLHSDISDISRLLAAERADWMNFLLNLIVVMSFAFGLAALIADPGVAAWVWGLGLAGVGAVVLIFWGRWNDRR